MKIYTYKKYSLMNIVNCILSKLNMGFYIPQYLLPKPTMEQYKDKNLWTIRHTSRHDDYQDIPYKVCEMEVGSLSIQRDRTIEDCKTNGDIRSGPLSMSTFGHFLRPDPYLIFKTKKEAQNYINNKIKGESK